MDISAINPVSGPDPLLGTWPVVLTAPFLVSAANGAYGRVAADLPASPAPAYAPVTQAPDAMPSLLQGAYRSPLASHLFSGSRPGDFSASREKALLHVMAPTAVAPSQGYATGQPFNPNAYPLNPATAEAMAAHLARTARAEGRPPPVQRIVSGTHEAVIRHSIDLFA